MRNEKANCAYRFHSAREKIGICKDEYRIMPSPGGKGDREAVDEEWRHLPILNAVKSKSTAFPNVPFYRNAYRFGTDRRSSSVPVCELGHLPPGGRYCAALILTNTNLSGSCVKPICTVCIWDSPSPVERPEAAGWVTRPASGSLRPAR